MTTVSVVLAGLIALITVAWGWSEASQPALSGSLPWLVRQQALYLSGLYALAFMSAAMILSTRPAWLERPLGGMDRVYRMHKWSGILAVGFAAIHWLIEMSDDVLKAWVGRAGRAPEEHFVGFLEVFRDAAEDLGEWAIYGLLAMLAIALWRRFPYGIWRRLHRVMPILYLMIGFHAALLAPSHYWTQPIGVLLATLLAGGSAACLVSLGGRIGRRRTVGGRIVSVRNIGPEIAEVTCKLEATWPGHRPGQFAFVTFDRFEGAHPFTIAAADHGDRTVIFEIKGLGNYTRGLTSRLHAGQSVRVEGPYGRFQLSRINTRAQQIWVAGGIGVTPFIAWLESLQDKPENAPRADLHYCTRGAERDPLAARLQALCAELPGIRLRIHDAARGERLSDEHLATATPATSRTEIWFCGPRGLAKTLQEALRRKLHGRVRFRQEAFELR
jgi:predicted ferric reductase